MSSTLTDHQRVLEQLQASADKISEVTAKLETQSELVVEHDNSDASHLDLRQQLNAISAVSPAEVNTSIGNHNTSGNAHDDIRRLIAELADDTSGITQVVSEYINSHNLDETSHADIRQLLVVLNNNLATVAYAITTTVVNHDNSSVSHDDIRTKLTTVDNDLMVVRNNLEYIEELDAVFASLGMTDGGTVSGSLAESIGLIENAVSDLRAQLTEHESEIIVLQEGHEYHEVRLTDMTSSVAALRSSLTATQLEVEFLKANAGTGGNGEGIDMTGVVHNLPPILVPGRSYPLTVTGLVAPEGDTVSLSLSPQVSGYTFSKSTDVAIGETIQLIVPANAEIGALKQFMITAIYGIAGTMGSIILVTKINTIPDTTNMILNMTKALEPGQTYPVTIVGATDVDGQDIVYSIDPAATGLSFSKTSGIAPNEVFTVTVPAGAVRGTVYSLDVTAHDSVNTSKTKTFTDFKVSILPNVTGLVHNVPALVKPGTTSILSFSGAVAMDGSAILYSVSVPAGSPLSFSKLTGINPGENINMIAATATPQRGGVFVVTITATDAQGAASSVTTNVTINSLPVSTSVATTLPATTKSRVAVNMQISGGSDPDGGALTYNIINSSGLVFSKTTGIVSANVITVTPPAVSVTTDLTFGIEVVDAMGEKSLTTKSVTISVTPVYRTAAPAITYPANGNNAVPNGFTMTVNPYAAELVL